MCIFLQIQKDMNFIHPDTCIFYLLVSELEKSGHTQVVTEKTAYIVVSLMSLD